MKKQMLWGMLAGLMAAGLLLLWQNSHRNQHSEEVRTLGSRESEMRAREEFLKSNRLDSVPLQVAPPFERIKSREIDAGAGD